MSSGINYRSPTGQLVDSPGILNFAVFGLRDNYCCQRKTLKFWNEAGMRMGKIYSCISEGERTPIEEDSCWSLNFMMHNIYLSFSFLCFHPPAWLITLSLEFLWYVFPGFWIVCSCLWFLPASIWSVAHTFWAVLGFYGKTSLHCFGIYLCRSCGFDVSLLLFAKSCISLSSAFHVHVL